MIKIEKKQQIINDVPGEITYNLSHYELRPIDITNKNSPKTERFTGQLSLTHEDLKDLYQELKRIL